MPQVDMIDESLAFAGVSSAKRAVDVGCGIGGSSRHIVRSAASSGRTSI
jgi:tocopherol O-methyltransferase